MKHGERANGAYSPEYRAWVAMNGRCYTPSNHVWRYYGGRGVKVCLRWRRGTPNAFANFLHDLGRRPKGHSLDRIDVDGHYTRHNCRWATSKAQVSNRRKHYVSFSTSEFNSAGEIYKEQDGYSILVRKLR
jgi:hypothetical protein